MTLKQIPFDITKIKPDAEKPQEWVKYRNGAKCYILCTKRFHPMYPIVSMGEKGVLAEHFKNGEIHSEFESPLDLFMFAPDLVGHLPKAPEGQEYHVPEGWEGELPEIPQGYRLAYKSEIDTAFKEGKFYARGRTWSHCFPEADMKCQFVREDLIIVPIQKPEFQANLVPGEEGELKAAPWVGVGAPIGCGFRKDLGLYRFFLENGKLKMEGVEG